MRKSVPVVVHCIHFISSIDFHERFDAVSSTAVLQTADPSALTADAAAANPVKVRNFEFPVEIPGRDISLANQDVLLFQTSSFRSSAYLTLTTSNTQQNTERLCWHFLLFAREVFHVCLWERKLNCGGATRWESQRSEFDSRMSEWKNEGEKKKKAPLWMSGAEHTHVHTHVHTQKCPRGTLVKKQTSSPQSRIDPQLQCLFKQGLNWMVARGGYGPPGPNLRKWKKTPSHVHFKSYIYLIMYCNVFF